VFKKRPFESAETLIYDPVVANRIATRASLYALGFNKVELADSLAALESSLKSHSPDLLLAELTGTETALCGIVQSVRQGLLGSNPFIVVIITTWRRDGDIVGQAVNCGADDLVARPFSTPQLGDRITAHVERRKQFVVTQEYSGPDRRRDASRPGAAGFDVPNTLRLRAIDGLTDDEAEHRIRDEVARGSHFLNGERLRLDAVQLRAQWRLLEQRQPGSHDFLAVLGRLETLAKDIKFRAASPEDSALDWCDSVIDSIQTVMEMRGSAPSGQEFTPPLHLLGQAVLTLGEMFAPEEHLAAAPNTFGEGVPGSRTQRPAA
jgi:DNA-binding response OmpR family regulator